MKSNVTHAGLGAKGLSDFPTKKRMWEYVDLLRRTSSNFCAIMAKALKIASVAPVMVTILSGDDPSDMLMRAPL